MAKDDQSNAGLSGAWFMAAMEHSPIGTALVGLDGRWLWTNQALQDTLGYEREELERLSFQDITYPDDLDKDLDQVERLIAGDGPAYQMEKRYYRKDGSIVWCLLSVSIVRDGRGTADCFISIVDDISARRAVEQDHAAVTERLTLATQAGGIGVWEWEIATGKMICDAKMFELYGLEMLDEPDYGSLMAAVDAGHRGRIEAMLLGAVAGICVFDTEFPVNLPTGDVRQLRALATVDCNAAGEPVRMIGTNWDITEQCRLMLLADESARSKSEFLATISHELRTPLNSIIGFSRLVLDSAPSPGEAALPPTAKRHIELVRDASATLLTIVDDVLDFSRIDAGGFELSPAPFDLTSMVENLVEIVRTGAETKGLDLSLSIAPDVPRFVSGDQSRLRQILLNLLGNAIKFTASGDVAVVLSMRAGEVHWQVRDSGIGISADTQHLLFKRFSQVDQSIARQYGGSGLGLAICERLVSAMGGKIGVDSALGKGSTFWFSTPLPVADAVRAPRNLAAIGSAIPAAPAVPRRILLAEDVEMNQMLAVALLERAGHSVAVVANGAEALERVQAERFDVVLMDVQMPVMDGIEATRRIRALGGDFIKLPIIAVTANVMPDDIARFRASGMSDHVGKPIPIDAFETMVRRWCPDERQEGALAAKFATARPSARSSAG